MLALLASVHDGDLQTVLVVLAIVAFALALIAGFVRHAIEVALVLALIGGLLLVFS